MAKFSGEKLKEARGRRTQFDLAAAMRGRGFGTTQTQVSRWEAGQAPRRYIIEALADELGVRADELFDEADEDAPLSSEEQTQFFSLLGKLGLRA